MNGYTFGTLGCSHLGYSYRGMRLHPSGRNLRAIDGYVANQLATEAMLDAGCSGIFHGGDVFHWSRPVPRDIEAAHRADDLRFDAGLWAAVNTGNHDAGAGAEVSAAAILDRPGMNLTAVYPHRTGRPGAGPHPGLYEIHQPDPAQDIYLHVVSHYGLDPALRDAGIIVDPQPLDHGINILCSHGIFVGDDRLYQAADRHGADRLIPIDWVQRGWDLTLLSDYHTPGVVEGYSGDASGHGAVWYTGSLLRRGFSDDESPRGWLQVTVGDGAPLVRLRRLWQRPQKDFAPIDARGMTVAAIDELVRNRAREQDWFDAESNERTGDGGWILRQRILGTTPAQRQALWELSRAWSNAAAGAAYWRATFDDNSAQFSTATASRSQASITARVTDFAAALDARTGSGSLARTLDAAAPGLRDAALIAARNALGAARDDYRTAS